MPGEMYSYIMPLLFQEGALDVFYTSIYMKKNRPGIKLTVLCKEEHQSQLTKVLFRETTTFGLRHYKTQREILDRRMERIQVYDRETSIKVGSYEGEDLSYSPEYELCSSLAKEKGIPLHQVYEDVKQKYIDSRRRQDGEV